MADCWGLYKRHGREAMIRHTLYYQELDVRGVWQDDYEAKYQKKAGQFTCVFDLQGLSARHMRPGLLPVLGYLSRIIQDTYPEIVKRVLIIRAPSIFKMIWGLVKHFFDPELRDLMVFGTNDENSQHVLEQYIDPNVLPKCIHPAGIDGPMARGYEHIIIEGGLIPPEGEYKTPEHVKTKALEHAALARRNNAGTLNTVPKVVVQTQGKTLISGSFDWIPVSASPSNDNPCTEEYKARVHIDKKSSSAALRRKAR